MTKEQHITGIILAAGMGTRLRHLTSGTTKALLGIGGAPLIAYAIKFLKQVGVDKIIVVGGHCFDLVRETAKRVDSSVDFYYNPHYETKRSIFADKVFEMVPGSFLLMNVDHLYHKSIPVVVTQQFTHGVVAYTDTDRVLADDDMKVLTRDDGSSIHSISKQLSEYDRGYVGLTFCHANHREKYLDALAEVKARLGPNGVLENVLQFLVDSGTKVSIGDISGYGWYEIDTPEDYKKAENAITSGSLSLK